MKALHFAKESMNSLPHSHAAGFMAMLFSQVDVTGLHFEARSKPDNFDEEHNNNNNNNSNKKMINGLTLRKLDQV